MTTFLIVDDSPFMRNTISRLINDTEDWQTLKAARDGEEALLYVEKYDPDVVILDINMPRMDGLTALNEIMKNHPRPCIILSAYVEKSSVNYYEAFELKAVGVLSKPQRTKTGQSPLSPADFVTDLKKILNSPRTKRYLNSKNRSSAEKIQAQREIAPPPVPSTSLITPEQSHESVSSTPPVKSPVVSLSIEELDYLCQVINKRTGICLPGTHQDRLHKQLQRQVELGVYSSEQQFYTAILRDQKVFEELVSSLTINATKFFRYPGQLDNFERLVPCLLERKLANPHAEKVLRIWSSACSTGQEPFTLALILEGFFKTKYKGCNYRITASDIDRNALNVGIKGRYEKRALNEMPLHFRHENYWTSIEDTVRGYEPQIEIAPRIKEKITFDCVNLADIPFRIKQDPFDIIFCCNVLMYFDEQTISQILRVFHQATVPGSILFTTNDLPKNTWFLDRWNLYSKDWNIYVRKEGGD